MTRLSRFIIPVLCLVMIVGWAAYTTASPAGADTGLAATSPESTAATCSVTDAVAPIVSAWGTGYDPDLDLNGNGRVDVGDIMLQIKATADSCAAESPLGFQMFEDIRDSAARQKAVDAGAQWVRLPASWENSNIDGAVRPAVEAGLEPIIVLGGSPPEARDGNHNGCGPIKQSYLPTFAAKVQQLVERYDGDGVDDAPDGLIVRHWEFWNEPDQNGGQDWVGGCWGDYPQKYANMLSYAYPAVKAANPDAKVLLGALGMESNGLFNMNFLNQVLNSGGGAYFDYTNIHQYDFKRDDWDGALPWNQGILGKIAATKAKVDKPVVVSEIGLKRDQGTDKQARHLVHEMVRGMSQSTQDVKALIWFLLVDEANNPTGDFGVLTRDTLSPFPAYYANRTLAQEFEQVDYEQGAVQLGPNATGSTYIQAFRFTLRDGTTKLVLWTDDGQRIKYAPDRLINMSIGASQLGGAWTGRLRVVESPDALSDLPVHAQTIVDGGSGDLDHSANGYITLQIAQNPIYVQAAP